MFPSRRVGKLAAFLIMLGVDRWAVAKKGYMSLEAPAERSSRVETRSSAGHGLVEYGQYGA